RLGIPVRGILGSSPERTREAVRELKIERGYSSLDELTSDSSVTAVHICTPNHLHHDQANAAMEAGKHVMCEKPLAMDTRQSHWLDLLTWITGKKVAEVCADLATVVPVRKRPRGRVQTFQVSAGESDDFKVTTDDYASILLRFDGSARGVVTVSQISAGRMTR